MPDYERIFDKMSLELAEMPEERAYAEGFIAGKNYARREMVCLTIFFFVLGLVVWASGNAL